MFYCLDIDDCLPHETDRSRKTLYEKCDINDKKVGVKLLLVLTLLTYFNIRSMF